VGYGPVGVVGGPQSFGGQGPDPAKNKPLGVVVTQAVPVPGEILDEIVHGIWQANAAGALLVYRNPSVRERTSIGGIVNVAYNIEQPYPNIPSLWFKMYDEVPIPFEWFDEAVSFQKRLSAEGKATLVHCAGGINRSSVTIMAMMMSWGASFEDAHTRLPRKPWGQPIIDSLRAWAKSRGR
jgi:hypothetical protein